MKPSWPGRVKLTSGASTPRKRIPVLPSSRLTTVSPSWTCWLMVPCWRPCMPNCAWPMVSPDGSCSIALAMRPPATMAQILPMCRPCATLPPGTARDLTNRHPAARPTCPQRLPGVARHASAPTGVVHRSLAWPWRRCGRVAFQGGLRPVRWSGPPAPGAMACRRWVSWPLDAPAGRRQPTGHPRMGRLQSPSSPLRVGPARPGQLREELPSRRRSSAVLTCPPDRVNSTTASPALVLPRSPVLSGGGTGSAA
jgi:hypothetical protein